MKSVLKLNDLLFRRMVPYIAGGFLLLALGACSTNTERLQRPEALSQIKPSHSPVGLASLRAAPVIDAQKRRPVRLRPLADLPKPLQAEMVTPEQRLQCVPYARDLSNIQIRGNAWTWWDQAEGRYERSLGPKAGAVMVLKRKNTGNLGHVAYVEEVVDSRMVIVSHANWLNEGRLHNNTPVLDVSEANDWSEVRFWHTPGGHFGGNIYKPYGFILPHQTFASR